MQIIRRGNLVKNYDNIETLENRIDSMKSCKSEYFDTKDVFDFILFDYDQQLDFTLQQEGINIEVEEMM